VDCSDLSKQWCFRVIIERKHLQSQRKIEQIALKQLEVEEENSFVLNENDTTSS